MLFLHKNTELICLGLGADPMAIHRVAGGRPHAASGIGCKPGGQLVRAVEIK